MEKKRWFDVFSEIKCPVCGKLFIPAPKHIYKDKRKKQGCVLGIAFANRKG